MAEQMLTQFEILKKFDNHEIAIHELGKNLTYSIKKIIKLENYVDFLETELTRIENDRL